MNCTIHMDWRAGNRMGEERQRVIGKEGRGDGKEKEKAGGGEERREEGRCVACTSLVNQEVYCNQVHKLS